MASSVEDRLPDGWEARKSRSTGMTYYLNKYTKQSQWEKPGSPAPVDDDDEYDEPKEVQCSHILVKHKDSRRPASWREQDITRTKEEAIQIVQGYRADIVNRVVGFDEIARLYSDCSSAKRDGDLGRFRKGLMQKPFEDVSFTLKIGQLSQLVETDSGIHIIVRTA